MIGAGTMLQLFAAPAHEAGTAPAATQAPPDPYTEAGLATMARKARYRLDEGLVFAWLFGTKYGQVDTGLRPLLNIESGAISRIENTSDGYAVTTWERTFYTALEDQTLLREWRNPYTGEVAPIRRGPSGPSTVHFLRDGTRVTPTELGGASLKAHTTTRLLRVDGDHVWLTNDSEAVVTRPFSNTAPFQVTEWSILHAHLSELLDPRTQIVEAEVNLQEVTSWPAWMNMGERPGAVTSRGVGRKVIRFESMPKKWRHLLAEHHPDIARRPELAVQAQSAPFGQ